jgi:transglutaminase-like putative cysteine protease
VVQAGSVVSGEKVSAWLPVPRRFPHQGEFELTTTVPGQGRLAPEDSVIRSVYLEGVGAADGSAMFEAEYTYVARGVSFDLGGSRGGSASGKPLAGGLEPYLTAGLHVEFTETMRRLAKVVGAEETNPVARARRYYDWISREVRYSYAPEYSTVRNLGEACRASGRGDCGQAAFLLMTLCRISGIPARWQSGWSIFPGDETIHDWCELYFEPWGWVPVDPYMGMYAMQYADALSPSQREELRDFYFGGLTQYRMAANADHGQALWPAKRSVRSDDVDFQRGEVEAGGRNLYFDRFRYDLKWEEISKP